MNPVTNRFEPMTEKKPEPKPAPKNQTDEAVRRRALRNIVEDIRQAEAEVSRAERKVEVAENGLSRARERLAALQGELG